MRTETPQTINLSDYTPSPYLVDTVALDFRLNSAATEVTSRLALRPNPDWKGGPAPLKLDGEQLQLREVRLDGEVLDPSSYTVEDDHLIVASVPQSPFTFETSVTIDPKANTALSGLYLSSGVYCTQCEAEGFRRITYHYDRPDVLARYRVRISAKRADAPVLLSNGNLIDNGQSDDGWHFAEWEDPFPKPSYLFALVAGDLAVVKDIFITMSGRDVALEIYVEHGKQDRCDWAMESLKKSMKWDEEAFGREYDLDVFMIVAVSDFNMGAMENKGLNVFNDKYILARPDTATDQDYANIESIIAHEYFHNWSGNRVTCRDWFQLCLKEGFTVFRDQEFTSDLRSRAVKRISDVRLLRTHQFPEDAGPLAHPVRPQSFIEINNFYTATVYEKGAEIVRLIKTLIGADAFRKGTDLYFERHDGDAATIEDFIACMAEASDRDLSQVFRWYEQAGTPELIAEGKFDAGNSTYELTISQKIPDTPGQHNKAPHLIPLELGLVGANGEDCELVLDGSGKLERPVIELTQSSHTFKFTNIGQRPVPSLNRGFTAPVSLSANLPLEDRLFLIAHDSDAFNRWESAQRVAQRLIIDTIDAVAAGQRPPSVKPFAGALADVLDDASLEHAFTALMLTLPGETALASIIGENVDPCLVHQARELVAAGIGQHLSGKLEQLWHDLALDASYSPDAASSGQRSLRHAALALIAAGDTGAGAELAYSHFASAASMTDKAGALVVLSQLDTARRNQALDEFYAEYSSDHLVVDKWLSLQALWPFPACAQETRKLMSHEAFSLTQPNKVRSLIGAFAAANPVCFNAADGSGYQLVAEVIVQLDKINPQIAARMAASFKSWRVLEPVRQTKAQGALQQLLDTPDLSRDTFEIVSRSLQ